MDKLDNYQPSDQFSGSGSDSDASGDSREDNSMIKQHAADGAHPELEFLLGFSEPQHSDRQYTETRRPERQPVERRQADIPYSLSRHVEISHTESRHAESRLADSLQTESRLAESLQTGSRQVDSRLAEHRHAKSRHTESQLAKSRLAESRHGENHHDESRHAESQPSVISYSRTSPYYSYPVIDMTKAHRIGLPQFHKIRVKSTQKKDLKHEVSNMFNVKNSMIHIIEEEGRKEEVLLKTIIVILPNSVGEEYYPLIVEWFDSMNQIHPQILCARFPVIWTVNDAKKLIAEELCWKGLVLCQNGSVLDDSMNLSLCNFRCLEKIQAMKQSCHRTEFTYQPRSDISSTYYLDIDLNWSVKQVKTQFETHFHDEIQKHKSSKELTIQFCFQDRLLEDKECIGLVLRKNIKEEKISIHFGSEDSMSIDLKFRAGRKTKHKLLIVSKEISTASLRAEVSKHLGVDPKAVKLTFEDKLIDEHDDLSQVYKNRWCSGCKIAAGIKKCKTLRIKHPTECEEIPFEMYMLEPVSVLKSKISERWGLNMLQISLFCRGIQMEHQQPLQYYPIKNNMEISLRLFEYRIILKVVILKGKKRISLVIDDSHATTVDDLLRFCAHRFGYVRQRSRGIFKEKCLDRKCTLAEEGIVSGDTVIISYFDQPNLLQGSLIKLFMVHEDGRMVQRIGTVTSGLLLHDGQKRKCLGRKLILRKKHECYEKRCSPICVQVEVKTDDEAPKTTEAPQTEEACPDNGHIPEGISVCEAKEVGTSGMPGHMLKSDTKRVKYRNGRPHSAKDSLKHKSKFLNRARRVIQQKYSQTMEKLQLQPPESEGRPSFYLQESDSENVTGGWMSPELELDEETGKKTVVPSKSNSEKSDSSNTEVKSTVKGLRNQRSESTEKVEGLDRCTECVRGEIESDGPTSTENEIGQHVKCIENCCQKIREVHSTKEIDEIRGNFVNASTPLHTTTQEFGLKEEKKQTCCNDISVMRDDDKMIMNEEIKSKNVDISPEQESTNYNTESSRSFKKETGVKEIEKKTSFHLTNDLSGCDTETSGCESSPERTKSNKLNIAPHGGGEADEFDSSDIDHVTSRHGEDCQCRRCWGTGQLQICPFLRRFSLQGNGRRKRRVHTVSESAVALSELSQLCHCRQQIPFNRTFPTLNNELRRYTEPNADIETAGITVRLLEYLATHLGNKWKHLLRKLTVDESTINAIDYQYTSSGLHELCFQALVSWKREKGSSGSQEVLLKAVEEIGLKSVVENCNNCGYFTA